MVDDKPAMTPGMYPGIPFHEYLEVPLPNASALKHLLESPMVCKHHRDNPKPPTPQMKFGTSVHAAILEPEYFDTWHVFEAADLTARGDLRAAAKRTAAGLDARHQPWITAKSRTQVMKIAERVAEHPVAPDILNNATDREITLITEWGKGRLDILCADQKTIVDVKTTTRFRSRAWSNQVHEFAYHVSAAWYIDLCHELGLQIDHYLFLVIMSQEPYEIAVRRLDEESIALGRRESKRLLKIWMECEAAGVWPAENDHITNCSVPQWALDED